MPSVPVCASQCAQRVVPPERVGLPQAQKTPSVGLTRYGQRMRLVPRLAKMTIFAAVSVLCLAAAPVAQAQMSIKIDAVPVRAVYSGDQVFVATRAPDQLITVQGNDLQVRATLALGGVPTAPVANSEGTRIYLALFSESAVVAVNVKTNELLWKIKVGDGPRSATLDRSGRLLYVANSQDGTVSVIDTKKRSVIATVPTGVSPTAITLHPRRNRAYVANSGSGDITILDTQRQRVMRTIKVCGVPLRPVMSPKGQFMFVSCRESGTLAIIDTQREALMRLVKVGNEPAPPTFVSGKQVFVPLEADDQVAVVRIPRGIVTDRIAVGEAPTTATLNRTGRLLFVPNTGGSSVSVINVVQGKVSRTIDTQPKPVQVILGSEPMVISETGFLQTLTPRTAEPPPPD